MARSGAVSFHDSELRNASTVVCNAAACDFNAAMRSCRFVPDRVVANVDQLRCAQAGGLVGCAACPHPPRGAPIRCRPACGAASREPSRRRPGVLSCVRHSSRSRECPASSRPISRSGLAISPSNPTSRLHLGRWRLPAHVRCGNRRRLRIHATRSRFRSAAENPRRRRVVSAALCVQPVV